MFQRSTQEYHQLQTYIQQKLALAAGQQGKDQEPYEINETQFNKLYWPVRDASLQIIKLSESILSRKLLFYSWNTNKGVIVRRILVPQGYQLTILPSISLQQKENHQKPTNPVQLFQTQLDSNQGSKNTDRTNLEDENDISAILSHLLEIRISLSKWKLLTFNPDLNMHPLEQVILEGDLLTIIQHKGYASLEEILIDRAKNQNYFSVQEVCHLAFQVSKYLTLMEFKRDFHLNISTTNLLVMQKPEGKQLDVKLCDFGIRGLYLNLYFELLQKHANKPTDQRNSSQSIPLSQIQKKYAQLSEQCYLEIQFKSELEEKGDQQSSSQNLKTKGELQLQALFEKDLLNRALINELIKHQHSEDLEETIKSLLLFYDRLCSVITIFRIIRLIPYEEFNKVVEHWFDSPTQKNLIDLRFIQIKLTQLLTANTSYFFKLLVGHSYNESVTSNENDTQLKMFQILIASLKVLLGPPDYVIADQLNREKKDSAVKQILLQLKQQKKVSTKNIRVAYQTLMIYHENHEIFPFIIKNKEQDQTSQEEKKGVDDKQKSGTINYLQQVIGDDSSKNRTTQDPISQVSQKSINCLIEIKYHLLFTNKFAGPSALLEKTEFTEVKKMFHHLVKKQSMNSYEHNIFDIQGEDDMQQLMRHVKQEQEPKPVSILVKQQNDRSQYGTLQQIIVQVENKLIIFRMNNNTLAYMHHNKLQCQFILNTPVALYVEMTHWPGWIVYRKAQNLFRLDSTIYMLKTIITLFNQKVGEQMGLKLSTSLLSISQLSRVEFRICDSMVTERFFFETLGLLFYGLPQLSQMILDVSKNGFGNNSKRNDPDYENMFQPGVLLRPYLDKFQENYKKSTNKEGESQSNASKEELVKESRLQKVTINAADNSLNDIAVLILCKYIQSLKTNVQLTLDLSGNPISDTAVKVLVDSILSPNLDSLKLLLNSTQTLTYLSFEYIKDIVQRLNGTLTSLQWEVEGVKVGMKGTSLLSQAFLSKEVTKVQQQVEEVEEEYEENEVISEVVRIEEEVEEEIIEEEEVEEVVQVQVFNESQENEEQIEQTSHQFSSSQKESPNKQEDFNLIELDLDDNQDDYPQYYNQQQPNFYNNVIGGGDVIGGNSINFVRQRIEEIEEIEQVEKLNQKQTLVHKESFKQPIYESKVIKKKSPKRKVVKSIRVKEVVQKKVQPIIKKRIIENIKETIIKENIQHKLEQLTLNLESSSLADAGISQVGQVLASLVQLNILNLNFEKNSISDVGSNQFFTSISNLANLEKLWLNFKTNRLGCNGMEKFSRLKCTDYLKSLTLNLYNNQLQDKGVAILGLQISKFVSLIEINLDVGMNQVQEGFFMLMGTVFSSTQKLESFYLDLNLNSLEKEPLSDRIEWPLRNLAKQSQLSILNLNLSQVTTLSEEFIILTAAIIGQLHDLKSLSLNFNKIACQRSLKCLECIALGLTELVQLTELNINMQRCKITDSELGMLSLQIGRLQTLQKLHINLQENDIKKSLTEFGTRVGQMQELIYLKVDFSKNLDIESDTCYTFLEQLGGTISLECLDFQMRECKITDDQLIELAKVIRRMETVLVVNLDLSKNYIKEKGAKVLGQCLIQMKFLRAVTLDLGLRQNNILYDASEQYRELASKLIFSRFM